MLKIYILRQNTFVLKIKIFQTHQLTNQLFFVETHEESADDYGSHKID